MIRMRVGVALLLLFTVFLGTGCLSVEKQDESKQPLVSISSMNEIREQVSLDEYGFNQNKAYRTEGKVKRNESLYLILRDLDVSPQKIYEINRESKGVFQSKRIKPGQRFIAYTDKQSSRAIRLILHENPLEYVVFDWENEVSVQSARKEVETEIATASGVIHSSLYETLVDSGHNFLLGNRLSEIFAWQIDFFRLYPGDNFRVIYEKQFVDGEPYGIGKIIAAEFENKSEKFDAFYYESDDRAGYYDFEGNGVQKALLKAPFKFSQRISSGFSHNRFHPVLKRRIPHYGVDYAAPLGTPVLAVGDGEIIEAQYRGANGNIVKIRHNSTYTTAYLHLNGFARGIRNGVQVKQGQVIGYVGRTGRVTGVHLDYRIYKNNRPVNPLTVKLPPSKSIEEENRDDFSDKVEELKEKLESIEVEKVVASS